MRFWGAVHCFIFNLVAKGNWSTVFIIVGSEDLLSPTAIEEECEDQRGYVVDDNAPAFANGLNSPHLQDDHFTSSTSDLSSDEWNERTRSSESRASLKESRFNRRDSRRSVDLMDKTVESGQIGGAGSDQTRQSMSAPRSEKEKRARARFYRKLSKHPYSSASSERESRDQSPANPAHNFPQQMVGDGHKPGNSGNVYCQNYTLVSRL